MADGLRERHAVPEVKSSLDATKQNGNAEVEVEKETKTYGRTPDGTSM